MSRDECVEAAVLTHLQAFDAFEDALRRLGVDWTTLSIGAGADAVLSAAVARVGAALGDRGNGDLAAQLRILLDAMRDLTPTAALPPGRPHFRPPLRLHA